MRKLRYLVGMAGLAAAATGLVAPAAMAGTTAVTKATPVTKIVVVSPVKAAAGCTGVIKANNNHNHEGTTFWYRKNGCIGTIQTITYANVAKKCANPQIRIYSKGKLVLFAQLKQAGKPLYVCNSKVTISWGVHLIFANPIGVWGKAPTRTAGVVLGPAGKTVN